MPFERGTFTFAMFELPEKLPENALALFNLRKACALDEVNEEPQLGWVTGLHLLDTDINANAMLGGSYYLMLRQSVRKMPASLLNALCRREERAYMHANELEFISSKMKKQIREETLEKYLKKMPPALSAVPMVLDPNENLLFVGASSRTQLDLFIDMFFQTVKIEPVQLTPAFYLEKEFQITEASFPELSLNGEKSSEPTIGRDFLTWLWYYSENEATVDLGQFGEFEVMIEAPLVFTADEARGCGDTSIKKGESPTRSGEAKAALAAGKKLKKAKLTFTRANEIWQGTFDADTFAFSSFKLPEGEAMNEDEVFNERVMNLGIFRDAFFAYFRKFAEGMTAVDSEEFRRKIRDWAAKRDAL